MRVLLTGAAGFIGTAIARRLTADGDEVVGIDALIDAAHPTEAQLPEGVRHLDVRDPDQLVSILSGVDVVCHQAAMVGAGIEVADLPQFASHNDLGTATLLAAMHRAGVGAMVLASSMVVYGEGWYRCPVHGRRPAVPRSRAELDRGRFDIGCPECGAVMDWLAVDESAAMDPRGGYAASKVAQEHYVSAWVRQAGTAAVALRYHNVYGPGMPRDTPYSGVAAIFRSALEAGTAPQVFEDGAQMRDFVHVDDVAAANVLALRQVHEQAGEQAPEHWRAYNVCSGRPVSIGQVATAVSRGTGSTLRPRTTGAYRPGDVRHIVASPERAARELGFRAGVDPDTGLGDFATAPLRSAVSPR